MSAVTEIAELLKEARRSGVPCEPPSVRWPELTVQEAYEVQARGVTGQVVGRKIGLTSEAVQKWLGVREPDFGVLTAKMAVLDGLSVASGELLQPRAEAEVAFVLGRDLEGPGVTAAEVIGATDYVLPAIEIIDSRIADWKITFEDTICDNASSGLFVLGSSPRSLMGLDLRQAGMALRKNGRVVSTGAGAACLGHPVNAVVWLANRLAGFGQGLKAGEVVLSGALGPVTPVEGGDFLRAEISGLGSVQVRFGREG